MITRPGIVFLFVGAALGSAPSAERVLDPLWTWRVQPAVEWAALAGRGDATTVLLATRDGRLHLIDSATGAARLSKPIAATAGIQIAGGQPGTTQDERIPVDGAYCFDRYAVYGVRWNGSAGLKWRHGVPRAAADDFPGDPEVLSGWVAAGVAGSGVVAVDRNGRVVLLSHEDGHVRWQVELGRLPVVRLHVFGDRAAILWKAEGNVQAVLLELGAQRPTVRPLVLDQSWPLWSTLVAEGLLTVSADGYTVWTAEGPPQRRRLDGQAVSAATVDVFVPRTLRDTGGRHGAGGDTLLVVGGGTRVAAYELSSGKRVWSDAGLPLLGADVQTLVVRDQHVLRRSACGVTVCDARTGDVLGRNVDPARRLVACGVAGAALYALYRERDEVAAELRLTRVELAAPTASRPTASLPAAETFVLKPPADVRRVLWTGREMVVVEADGVAAYALP